MPPLPKHPSARARRNVTTGPRTLHAVPNQKTPALPKGEWRSETKSWWRDIWKSPMAPEYDASDLHGLLILAVLVDAFWKEPSEKTAGEIRLQRRDFGLTPYDRRRLQWEIDRGDEAEVRTEKRRAARKPKVAGSAGLDALSA